MKLISLHRKSAFIDYQNHLFSVASLITFAALLISVVLPLVWIFKINNDSFLQNREFVLYQQPMVQFQYKYIILIEHQMTEKITLCSSFPYLNQRKGTENCAKVKFMEIDSNYDGVPDELEFNIDFQTMYKSGVKSFSFVAFLDSRLNQCNFRIPSALIINEKKFINNMEDRKIVITGTLQPSDQDHALVCPFFLKNTRSHFFFEKLNENTTTLDEFKISRIQENLERNPMHFRFRESSTDIREVDRFLTSIEIKLKIPQTAVRYRKTFWQLLNDFWINYISVFAVSFLTCKLLLTHLFDNRWLIARKQLI